MTQDKSKSKIGNLAKCWWQSFLQINYRMFFALLLLGLLPTVYTLLRIYLLGQLPDASGFDIASQMQWVEVLYEILQEAFIVPLYYFIARFVPKRGVDKDCDGGQATATQTDNSTQNQAELTNRVRTGLLVVLCVYGFLSVLLIAFAKPILIFMQQGEVLVDRTVQYIRLETVANIFGTLFKYALAVLVCIKREVYLYILLGLQMVLSIVLDIFFVSNLQVSWQLGVNGVAVTNIIVNLLLLVMAVILLHKEQIKIFCKDKMSFAWLKGYLKVGGVSGIESLVRNAAFILMIVRVVNEVGEQGTFWVANNFIWGWLLLPVLQLGELVKRDIGASGQKELGAKVGGYFVLTAVFVVFWFVTLPLWQPFMKTVLGFPNARAIFDIVLISLAFYILFAFNNVIDSVFYGLGKPKYMLYQSIVVNGLVNGVAFVLYATKVWSPTLLGISLLFALGIGVDSLLTYGIYAWWRRRNKKQEVVAIDLELAA
ncbi:MAG: multidrug transporter [Firmicutes bacterium]|nr:multidrug transporter [Bacillota bacterium]